MTKAARHHLIRQLLTNMSGEIINQDQLQQALAQEGVSVAQPTLSRDLREIGVLKGATGYLLSTDSRFGEETSRKHSQVPQSLANLTPGLQRTVRTFVTQINQGESIVVVRTTPAAAQTVAAEFDNAKLDGVIGTVAGDDTIFLACQSTHDASRVRSTLAHVVGITEPARATTAV